MLILAMLFLLAQDIPASPPPAEGENEEIVVQATYGTTTMLFDKGADGKLRNCRVMVSSGSQRRDTNACQATPVCYEKTRDTVTECVELSAIEPAIVGGAPGAAAPPIFDMPKLVQPKAAPLPGTLGPVTDKTADNEKQRVKALPPPPSAPTSGSVVTMRLGDGKTDKEN